jgi:uncharacterized membrane-anchored protein YhcB (DUF1043 family)
MNEGQIILALISVVATVVGLFGWLLKKTMEENSKREAKYQATLDKVIDKFDTLKVSVDNLAAEVRK